MQFGWLAKGLDRVGLAESLDFYHTFVNFNIRRFQPPASIVRCRFCFYAIGLERSHVVVALETLFRVAFFTIDFNQEIGFSSVLGQ